MVGKPLVNVRVLEMGRMYAAPWAAMLMADMGAEVVKIESPGGGDMVRSIDHGRMRDAAGNPGDSGRFAAINRNKKSITVDITSAEGQETIRRLAAKADVFIENYKVGDLARRKLDYASIHAVNERIVYASVTGFGQSGPYAHRPAIDPIAQAFSGYMAMNGEPGQPPQKTTFALMDFTTGMFAAFAVMTALFHQRANGGPGQHIDIGMMDAAVSFMSYLLVPSLIEGKQPLRMGNRVLPGWAPGGLFRCSDGLIYVTIGNNLDLKRFFALIDRPDLPEDPRFRTLADRAVHEAELNAIAQAAFDGASMVEWVTRLGDAGILAAAVYEFADIPKDPQAIERDLIIRVPAVAGGPPIPTVRNPIRMSETPVEDYRPAPSLGHDTDEVLRTWLGTDTGELARLHDCGALGS
ncbi:MAG: CaiB/BaiF CoA transferase family protein [Burkholderiaceae bacterium]